jgi:hypothetical protein
VGQVIGLTARVFPPEMAALSISPHTAAEGFTPWLPFTRRVSPVSMT